MSEMVWLQYAFKNVFKQQWRYIALRNNLSGFAYASNILVGRINSLLVLFFLGFVEKKNTEYYQPLQVQAVAAI